MNEIEKMVKWALEEDVGAGDITAQLIDVNQQGHAVILAREPAVVCGRAYVDEVFRQVDDNILVKWLVEEGAYQSKPGSWIEIKGTLRSILTAERTALNFLQTLSAVASKTKRYVDTVQGYPTRILDTRKTIPGLRWAQKYAVRCGGGVNHRMGLYDEFLIKENHIESMGSISKAIRAAQACQLNKPIIVEVQNIEEFKEAHAFDVQRILLDNFTNEMIEEVIACNHNPRRHIEVSGGIDDTRLLTLAKMGVDFVSVGDLTKSIQAIDLSLLIKDEA